MRRPFLALVVAVLPLAGCAVTPEPLTTAEVATFTEAAKVEIAARPEPLNGPLTLEEALARAIKYNLDAEVELRARDLAEREFDRAGADALPGLVGRSTYFGRDRDAASSSKSVLSGLQSLEPSVSTDNNRLIGDLELTWNILDFGLSYVRARQAADRILIAEENRRRVMNRIVEDTRTAYFRAAAYERLTASIKALAGSVEGALKDTRALSRGGATAPLPSLAYERELITIRRDLETLERDLAVAREQLAALVHLPLGRPFRIAAPDRRDAPPLGLSAEAMVDRALAARPEIRQALYEMRIVRAEADAALLKLLPGVDLYGGLSLDTNSYLVNSNWIAWGARASWNLIGLLKYPNEKRAIDARGELLRQRALATTLAVMTQVHVARARFAHRQKELRTARDLVDVQTRILAQVTAEILANRGGNQDLVRERMNALVAETRLDLAVADLENARANLRAAMGEDVVDPAITSALPLADIVALIRRPDVMKMVAR